MVITSPCVHVLAGAGSVDPEAGEVTRRSLGGREEAGIGTATATVFYRPSRCRRLSPVSVGRGLRYSSTGQRRQGEAGSRTFRRKDGASPIGAVGLRSGVFRAERRTPTPTRMVAIASEGLGAARQRPARENRVGRRPRRASRTLSTFATPSGSTGWAGGQAVITLPA